MRVWTGFNSEHLWTRWWNLVPLKGCVYLDQPSNYHLSRKSLQQEVCWVLLNYSLLDKTSI